jgi:hypothetical protein
MAEDLSNRVQADRSRININEKHELKHWSKRFSVSPDRLREVVGKVGSRIQDVERELSHGGGSGPGRDAST